MQVAERQDKTNSHNLDNELGRLLLFAARQGGRQAMRRLIGRCARLSGSVAVWIFAQRDCFVVFRENSHKQLCFWPAHLPSRRSSSSCRRWLWLIYRACVIPWHEINICWLLLNILVGLLSLLWHEDGRVCDATCLWVASLVGRTWALARKDFRLRSQAEKAPRLCSDDASRRYRA